MGATSRSDAMTSLQTTSQSDLAGATPRSRSPFHPGGSRKLTRSDLSERPLQVAPEAQSDLARVTPRDEESGDESADEQAPTKRAKTSKGKEVADDRDRAKTPSVDELYHHLLRIVCPRPRVTYLEDLSYKSFSELIQNSI
ncbi:hypothetical protein F2Q69_00028401 [Brassica cretica]|uniref:Uncharacterized protein n=1 Tax=Brassica cretica TaxID=69181 RepID=A0A8S9RSP7_BRACR|nr:hypothetical protein F2Q69_00028401 [Brassica cretica]